MTLDPAERWRRVAALADGALEREPAARAAYLEQACAGEDGLQAEVEELLTLASTPSFLDSGALRFAAPLLEAGTDEGTARSADESDATGLLRALARERRADPASPSAVPEHVRTEPGAAYELERELGRGGMATVYLARDSKHGRRLAVKVLSPGLATLVGADDFVREIRLTARLQHPHILGLIDSGVFGREAGALAGRPYYTMPYVDGESLRARLSRGHMLPLGEAVRLLRDTADALSYAHEQGVVHRDVKPENILLTGGHAVVADFGIARALFASRTEEGKRAVGNAASDGKATLFGTVVGTPAYMAPEQAEGRLDVDPRADVYAWAVVAYEVLAGRHPFGDGTSPHECLAAHLGETPRPLRDIAPAVPPALAALVMRCLSKEPADRPRSGAEILAALDSVLLTTALPAPRRLSSQPRTWLGALAGLVFLLTLVAAGTKAYRGMATDRRLQDGADAGRARIARASARAVVVGTGDPAVDVPAVQRAVDRSDTVVLEGRFSFDAPPTKPLALQLASGWFPPAAEVLVTRGVVISGVRDAHGEMATIEAGTLPFYIDAPGEPVVVRGLRFVRPISGAILVYAVRGLEIASCRIEGVVPFAHFGHGIAIDTHGRIPMPASPGRPQNVFGRLLIQGNDIDADGGTTHDGTSGVVVFGVGQPPEKSVELDIIGNEVRNTSTSAIIIRRVAGRVRVLGNTLVTGREIGVWGSDAVRLVNSGSYLMANNSVECRWADCTGIAVYSPVAEWPVEHAVVEDNYVLMSPPADAAFSDSSAGISIRGYARSNVVRHNTVGGRARSGLAMYAFRGGVPSDNEFIDNRFQQFNAALADIVVGSRVVSRRIAGPGTVADRGRTP